MPFLVARLADLTRHLPHLRALRPRRASRTQIAHDLSLHDAVLFSLLVVTQTVIDIAGELAARQGIRFQDYTEAIRALRQVPGFPPDLVEPLVRLPGFRNVVIHEYADADFSRVLNALDDLEPIERFARAVAVLESAC